MAVSFRHGSNGAYKSSYVTWFEILPALRQGHLVVTNIEGLKPKESIEKLIGEKFPDSACLIRIFTRSKEGIELWQNWFSWMPIGAFVVIDECQDLYCPEVGFKREKFLARPLSDFIDLLPSGFSELFYSRWLPVDPDSFEDGDTDDCERTQLDENNRLLYPDNFYGGFTRHRKYQWDIVLLTPDYTSIPTWLRGCAGEAYSHRSTDTFFRKRRPRIFNHPPKSTKTAPSSKSDFASCSSKKIPVDVFALYKSTGTGGFNETKSDISILKSPKFILVILVGFLAIGKFFWDLAYVLSDSDVGQAQNVVEASSSSTQSNVSVPPGSSVPQSNIQENRAGSDGLGSSSHNSQVNLQGDLVVDDVNPFYEKFSIFNGSNAVYLTSVDIRYRKHLGLNPLFEYVFRIDKGADTFYVRSEVLLRYGYRFELIDDCLIQVSSVNVARFLTCPPNQSDFVPDFNAKDSQLTDVREDVNIFDLPNG